MTLRAAVDPVASQRPMGERYLISGGTVLSLDASVGDFPKADVLVDRGRIVEIAPSIEATAEVLDATGMIVMPGLVDSHRHHWSGMFRTGIPNADGMDYSRLAEGIAPFLREEDVYDVTLMSNLSAIDCGMTSILDYMHGSSTPDLTDAAVRAHLDSGIRSVFAFCPPRLAHFDPSLSSVEDRTPAGQAKILPTAHHPQYIRELRDKFFASADQLVTLRLGTPLLSRNYAFAREVGLPIISDAVYGGLTAIRPMDAASRLRDMAAAGELGPDVTLIHCTCLPDDVFKLLADNGVCIILCPTSDATLRGLGDSVSPIQQVMDFGLMDRTGLSVDIEVSLSPDIFSQMHAIFLIQRVLANRDWARGVGDVKRNITVKEILRLATLGGATAIGNGAKSGTLTPGKRADITIVRAEDLSTGPLNNAYGTIVVGANPGNVDTVIVDGRIAKWRGNVLGFDIPKLMARVKNSRDYLAERTGLWTPNAIVG